METILACRSTKEAAPADTSTTQHRAQQEDLKTKEKDNQTRRMTARSEVLRERLATLEQLQPLNRPRTRTRKGKDKLASASLLTARVRSLAQRPRRESLRHPPEISNRGARKRKRTSSASLKPNLLMKMASAELKASHNEMITRLSQKRRQRSLRRTLCLSRAWKSPNRQLMEPLEVDGPRILRRTMTISKQRGRPTRSLITSLTTL